VPGTPASHPSEDRAIEHPAGRAGFVEKQRSHPRVLFVVQSGHLVKGSAGSRSRR
jgi:hypothetical protein